MAQGYRLSTFLLLRIHLVPKQFGMTYVRPSPATLRFKTEIYIENTLRELQGCRTVTSGLEDMGNEILGLYVP